jgi:DNA helicase II / ATP-dependent DNA helicase PcrA
VATATLETQETQRLADVLVVIEQQIKALERKRVKGSEELVSYRKYMWEDAALFDRAERVQTENVALTQERAVMDVAVRLKRLRKLASSPYFGRIDFRETGLGTTLPVYIGLHGLIDDLGELLIHDWRAPISGMFYDYEVGPADYEAPEGVIAGDLVSKRQYKIEGGRMLYVLDSSLTINDDILRDALARNTTQKMRQIVNSIQKEQNAIIRSEGSKVLIVQGPAGSGKTSIAMHRAAYLLYRHQGHVAANNLLIFSPNEVFADYISNVLPELGEENIREATFEDYARSILDKKLGFETKAEQMEFVLSDAGDANHALRTAAIAFKSSPAYLRILRRYVRYLKFTNLRFEDIRINDALVLPGRRVKELYKEYCWDRPLVPAIERLKDRVLANSTYSTSIAERKIEQEVEKVLVTRDPLRLYRDMFKDPEVVRKLAEGEQVPDDLAAICRLTLKNLRSKKIPYEDVAPILLLKRLVEGEPRYANIKHVIIDEAQDYTPVHFEIIRNLFGGSSVTILGDLSQRVNSYSGLDSYDALRQVFGKDTEGVMKLTKSYRSTQEITDFAHGMLADGESVDNIRSTGRKPTIVRAESDQLAGLISEEMDRLKADGSGSIAVICKTATEAMSIYSKLLTSHDVRLVESGSITFHHGLVVLPAYLAKGLEFDAVIIHDAGARIYGSDSERTLLYTACTRALHSLTVYFTGEPSPLLPFHKQELFDYR